MMLYHGKVPDRTTQNNQAKLQPVQRSKLDVLLLQFSDVLSRWPGRTQTTECHIQTGTAPPIRLPPYRLPHAYRDVVKGELEEMEKDGIIEPSSSEWALPIVLMNKKDGSLRMCVDYWRLNSIAETDAYLMPRVDDMIDTLGKAKYITTLDLHDITFRVMLFSLHGARTTFQRMMDQLLVDCTGYAGAYLDDVVIHSSTWEDHIRHIKDITNAQEGRAYHPSEEVSVRHKQCTYLGYIVGNGEVRPEEPKLQVVRDFPTPTTKKRVRAFLGLTGYYRKLIPGYSKVVAPLTDLTRNLAPT